MGARKRLKANQIKEEKANKSFAILKNCPTSPRKMRLVADIIRGVEVNRALDILKFSAKHPARDVEKLLLSAISNWQSKNESVRMEDADLYVKEIYVDSGRVLKRIKPAPQGRGYKIRKRSNHVTLVIDNRNNIVETENA
ncbi:MAG: 50S ribosomal protein L22 [Bacteroidales bacterium]|jgi:large subunit ribosomal protein L22|nr:50S ribosomal protein L22 [Bacteroidales bacterium]